MKTVVFSLFAIMISYFSGVQIHAAPIEIDLSLYEKKQWSRNGEEGVLLKIFEIIGTTNRYYVEFGAQDGTVCNTRYLRQRLGWYGLMMDGSYSIRSIGLYKEFITAENINYLFSKYYVPSEFDLLSIAVDFNDLWIWNAIDDDYKPRVVVIEYASWLGPTANKVVVYNPYHVWDGTYYSGASITALYNLGRKKGYSLVYAENRGVNLFFIRDDVLENLNCTFKNTNNVGKIYRNQTYFGYKPDKRNRLFVSFD